MAANKVLPEEPIIWMKMNQEKVGVLIIRYLMAMVWLSQGFAKLFIRSDDPWRDYNFFLSEVNYMAMTNPIPIVVTVLQDVIIPNIVLFTWLVILIELTIGSSLALGLFTRAGAALGGIMTINLWILTLGWGEWIWTYPLIFFPHVLLFLSRSGKYVGVDRLIEENKKDSIITKLG